MPKILAGPEKMKTLPAHFDGTRFRNLIPRRHGFGAALRWMVSRRQGQWRKVVDSRPSQLPPRSSERLRVTFVNHSTFLIQLNGINILTDPVWSERASPVSWIGPRRVRAPGVSLGHLPPIDLILLSHDHYDHLDLPTLRLLAERHRPTIYAGLKMRPILALNGIQNVVELDWWQEAAARTDMWLTAVPAQHFSGRTPFDRDKRLWCGFVLQTDDLAIYFAGDTGAGPQTEQIAQHFPELDLAILPIGAFRPEWFIGEVHMSPQDAVQAHITLGARVSVASHFGTFPLADDGDDEALHDLHDILGHTDLHETEFWVLRFGEGREVPLRSLAGQSRRGAAR
jgi:L-ascorbate metabolism protein UlaG (beta-lactamase superfamily)